MVKIKKMIGFSSTTTLYELENGKHIEVLEERSNGETMRAWFTDEIGIATGERDFEVRPVYILDKEEEDSYELIGFEKVV